MCKIIDIDSCSGCCSLFYVSGMTNGRPVEEVVRIFIEAYSDWCLILKVKGKYCRTQH